MTTKETHADTRQASQDGTPQLPDDASYTEQAAFYFEQIQVTGQAALAALQRLDELVQSSRQSSPTKPTTDSER